MRLTCSQPSREPSTHAIPCQNGWLALQWGHSLLSRWNPDKHLRIRNPRLRLALRMIWHCMVVSSIGGALFTLPFLLVAPNSGADNATQAMILAIFFGGGTALPLRLLASILTGAVMAIVSGGFSTPITNPWVYRLAMALATTTIVHLFAPFGLVRFYLLELTAGEYDARWEIPAVIAVYAGAVVLSQVMAGKYMRETTS